MNKNSQTTYPQLTTIPKDELGKIFVKLKAAMDLKYNVLDVLYPKMFCWQEMGPNSVLEMRDVHMENFEKLKKIREIIEGYQP
jgi:hypothetical protein